MDHTLTLELPLELEVPPSRVCLRVLRVSKGKDMKTPAEPARAPEVMGPRGSKAEREESREPPRGTFRGEYGRKGLDGRKDLGKGFGQLVESVGDDGVKDLAGRRKRKRTNIIGGVDVKKLGIM